jgi:acyl-CoA reductase-like NAD-dependent aldehyde dehydrogenase
VAAAGPQDVNQAVAAARAAFDNGPWPRLDPSERIDTVRRLAKLYSERRSDMAAVITAEMRAPISFAKLAHVRLPWLMMSAFCDPADTHPWQARRPGR